MDGKRHQLDMMVGDRRERHQNVRRYRRIISRFLQTQKQNLLTSCLFFAGVVLLFGIFIQIQPPLTSKPPDWVKVIGYSTFVRQVRARNVMAVIIQGHVIHGLQVVPFLGSDTFNATQAAGPSSDSTAEIAVWSRHVIAGYPFQLYIAPARASQVSKISLLPTIDRRRFIYTHLPESGDANLASLLLSNHVVVKILTGIRLPSWFGSLWNCATLLLYVLMLPLILNARKTMPSSGFMIRGVNRLGKNRTRSFERVKEKKKRPRRTPGKTRVSQQSIVTFADVAGIDEVRGELEEIVQFLRSPEHFQRLGARIPRGALLVGPPGTGKTLLAKAVAGEAGVPFFNMSASEFVEMYVGLGASRVRTLFSQARESAPCVIFLDELDAVGRKRSMSLIGNEERDQALNQLLVELDGVDSSKAVVVLAATNRADVLDQALLRPGRFDRHITVSLPDRVGRAAILKVHTRRTPLHEDVSLARLSRLTTGMSGADLANLVNEAALSAARQNLEQLTQECFEEALARVQLGALRPLVMSEADRRIISFHEGGHALVAYHLPQADTVNRVTILPRGQSLGVTQLIAEEDRYNYSRDTLMARIAVGLGGRVAEELAFGQERITTGAENDLQAVTDLARRMVTRWGMSRQIGVVFAGYRHGEMSLTMQRTGIATLQRQACSLLADGAGQLLLNGMTAHRSTSAMSRPAAGNSSTTMGTLIDYEMQHILNEGYAMAHALLSEHYDQLVLLADALVEYEQLDRSQFEALLERACVTEDSALLPVRGVLSHDG